MGRREMFLCPEHSGSVHGSSALGQNTEHRSHCVHLWPVASGFCACLLSRSLFFFSSPSFASSLPIYLFTPTDVLFCGLLLTMFIEKSVITERKVKHILLSFYCLPFMLRIACSNAVLTMALMICTLFAEHGHKVINLILRKSFISQNYRTSIILRAYQTYAAYFSLYAFSVSYPSACSFASLPFSLCLTKDGLRQRENGPMSRQLAKNLDE